MKLAWVMILFCGCGTTYKHTTTHADGTRTVERLAIRADLNNPQRIPFGDVPPAAEVQVPGGLPEFRSRGMAAVDSGLGFQTASGAVFWANSHDSTSPSFVHWNGINGALARIGTTILGVAGFDAYKHKNAVDAKTAQRTTEVDAREAVERAKIQSHTTILTTSADG